MWFYNLIVSKKFNFLHTQTYKFFKLTYTHIHTYNKAYNNKEKENHCKCVYDLYMQKNKKILFIEKSQISRD